MIFEGVHMELMPKCSAGKKGENKQTNKKTLGVTKLNNLFLEIRI